MHRLKGLDISVCTGKIVVFHRTEVCTCVSVGPSDVERITGIGPQHTLCVRYGSLQDYWPRLHRTGLSATTN